MTKKSSCGHSVEVKCCEEAKPLHCARRCTKKLNCGHLCTSRCKDPCTRNCEIKVKLTQTGLCGHSLEIPCYLSKYGISCNNHVFNWFRLVINNFIRIFLDPKNPILLQYCREPCKTQLECSHQCRASCGECKQGRIHKSCTEKCSKILVCGHKWVW